MLSQRALQRLNYIAESIERVEEYIAGDVDRLLGNVLIQDAVLRRLETLADASSKLPEELQQRHPEVAWRRIRGFRNVAAHAYEGIDMLRIWDIVENYLPALQAAVVAELRRAEPAGEGEQHEQ